MRAKARKLREQGLDYEEIADALGVSKGGVERDRLTYRVHIHETADVAAAEQFWADVVGVHVGVFRKPTIKRHNPKTLRKNVGEDYHGCLAVSVLRSSELYQKIAGWAEGAMRATLRPG